MSNPKGDFLTISLLESKGYDPLVYRMFCLQSHYRKPLEFSYEALDNTSSAYSRLKKRIATLQQEGEIDKNSAETYRVRFCANSWQ